MLPLSTWIDHFSVSADFLQRGLCGEDGFREQAKVMVGESIPYKKSGGFYPPLEILFVWFLSSPAD